MRKSNGSILWRGLSLFDGAPIVAIVTGLLRPSVNPKTGPMLQTWIMREDVPPHDALKSEEDSSVCGDCPLASGRGCYVRVGDAPLSVWRAYHRGVYSPIDLADLADRDLRIGAYGDPAAVPSGVWHGAIAAGVRRWTGYTHAWRYCDQSLRHILMASCDSPADRELAESMGWRSFRGKLPGSPLLPGEVSCPASDEAGNRTSCDRCGLCDGTKYDRPSRADIAIDVHGWRTGAASETLLQIGGAR